MAKKMNAFRFVWISLRVPSEKTSKLSGERKRATVKASVDSGAPVDTAVAHAAALFQQRNQSFYVLPAFVAGLAGNLMAASAGHFIDAVRFAVATPADWAWSTLGAVALLLIAYLVFWAKGVYEHYYWLGSGASVGARSRVR